MLHACLGVLLSLGNYNLVIKRTSCLLTLLVRDRSVKLNYFGDVDRDNVPQRHRVNGNKLDQWVPRTSNAYAIMSLIKLRGA